VRIIAGRHKGRRLAAPRGQAVRPTSDRAREALFNILVHGRFAEGPVFAAVPVLDVFAGTGAFGLEALSRGASHATFIEKDRAALALLRSNVAALGETERATLLPVDATRLPRAAAPAALAFLDPPYGEELAAPALAALAASGWLAPGALVIVELAARQDLAPPPGFTFLEERRYGAARFVFLRHEGG
jgi:16S rRNA (guanine966-N2)-methyltransferase